VLTVVVLSASPVTLFAQQSESDDTSFELDVMTFNIRALDPEVLGLQEALTAKIDFLQSEMSEYRWLGVDRGLNGGVGLGDDPNPPTQRGRVARIVTWARFHHLETLRQFYVYNTHFTIRGGSRQIQSAELVIRSR
jgi:endonuclease/exonuclease/phosphatase family metal-dependent hydrolase